MDILPLQYISDYKFEDIWTDPEKCVEALKKYRAVLTPDFSMYLEMHPVMQLYNIFRNRWVGAFLANRKIKVVPTVNWGDEATFDFCFEGIAKGSAVAVSTYMASEHDNHKDQKEWFLKGYNEMLRRIEPAVIICYHTPFPEMEGKIVHVDYELSSWKHDKDDLDKAHEPSEGIRIVKRTGYVVFDKGGGSAFGGEWRPDPNKPDDARLIDGRPGDITRSNRGYDRDTVYGEDGRAVVERHYGDHWQPKAHSDPHDHFIDWSKGFPEWRQENYFDGNVPDLGDFAGWFDIVRSMRKEATVVDRIYPKEDYRFATISEFKWSMSRGGEVGFLYGGKAYFVHVTTSGYNIGECYRMVGEKALNPVDGQLVGNVYGTDYASVDGLLDHMLNGSKLREIIRSVEVFDRLI